MTAQPSDLAGSPLSGAITCERLLAVQWTPLQATPSAAEQERWQDEALRVLSAVGVLDENRAAATPGDEGSGVEGELARLHQKVNLLLDLVALMVAREAPAQDERRVTLSRLGAAWPESQPLSGPGLVAIHLHRSVPQPLRLAAQVVAQQDGLVQVRFEPLREPLQTALERHVFVHHRRAVASARRPPAA